MKNYVKIANLNFLKRLFGLLLFLLVCINSFSQSVCRPTSGITDINGICIGAAASNPERAFDSDANLTTYATLVNSIGIGCTVEEVLTFNQTAKAGDQIVIYFGTGNGLLDLSLLSNASIQARLGVDDVGERLALNSPILNLNLLSGNRIAMVKYTVPSDVNKVQIRVGGLLSLLVNLRVYDVRLDFAKPTISGGTTQTICYGNKATLTATPAAGTTVDWYDSPTAPTALISGDTFTTPALTANTTYYVGVTRLAGCEGSERLPVVVNVSNPIAPAINTFGTAICSSGATQQTTLSVINPIPGTTYSWFSASSGGTALATGNTYSPTVPTGVTSFFVEASIGNCLSPTRTQVNVTSVPIPATPTVLTQSVTIQSGQNATLNATTTEANVVLNWYDVASGGIAIASNTSSFTTPSLTATKTYYVEAKSTIGDCTSTSRVSVTVTVIATSLGTCLDANSQQTNANGLCLLCGVSNPNNSVDGDVTTAASLTVPVGLLNGWIQQTLQFNNPGKAGDIIDVILESPGGILDLGVLSYISLATYNSATFNNDRVSINNLLNVQLLGGNKFKASIVAGGTFDRVEIRLGGVATVLTTLNIYNASYGYKSPVITGNTTICAGQNTTLTAGIAVGETVAWYDASTGGNLLSSATSFPTPVLTASTTYYVQVTRNGCVNSERLPVAVTVNNPIAPTIAATGTTICSGQTTTLSVANPVTGTTYKWYDLAAAGTLLNTGNTFTSPVLTSNKSYFVEAGIGTCTNSSRSQVDVIVNPLPAAPTVVSSNVNVQSGQSALLQVSNPVVGVTYEWFDASTNQSKFVGSDYQTAPLTVNTSFYVLAKNTASGCINPTKTMVNVIVNKPLTGCLRGNNVTTTYNGLLCVLCGVNTPNNSADNNIDSAASLSIPLGLGQDIFQEIDFTNPGLQGDIIEVELGIPSGLLDIGLLSNVTLQSYNGGANNPDLTVVSNPLLNIQILGGRRFRASFAAVGDFTGVRVTLGGLATVLTSLDIYNASYRYKNAVISGNTTICEGSSTTLTATSSVATETFLWYDSPSGLTPLNTVPSATYTTSNLNSTTNYYLEASRGTCENSARQVVTVTVLKKSVASDITISTPLTASCTGEVTLAPTSTLVSPTFRYYLNSDKTGEITTGINGTTGALTVTGLTQLGSPYTYYVSVTNALQCENDASALKQVIVNFPSIPVLNVNATLAGCDKANLKEAIANFDTSGNTTYTFYNPSNVLITAEAAANITTDGTYFVEAQTTGVACLSGKKSVLVSINASPSLVVADPVTVASGTPVVLAASSNGTLAWFDPQGNALSGSPTVTLTAPGTYAYTVIASNINCSKTGTFFINIIDPNACQSLTERIYATSQSPGNIVSGTVSNGGNAIDGDVKTYSTISTGFGLLGVGTTWQNLQWPSTLPKGTPVTVKLGSEYSGVSLAENLSVVGTVGGVVTGNSQSVSGSLLKLLSGENSFEFTFVPTGTGGPIDYDGIRIQSSALLSVSQNTRVYDASYNKQVAKVTCTPGDIKDVLYGVSDLGVGVATTTVGVSDAWNVTGQDVANYATMYSGAGIAAAADLTVVFKTPTIASDTLRIVVSKPNTVLTLSALSAFSIQRFLGNVAVGAPIDNSASLLKLSLLGTGSAEMVLSFSQPEKYDRVRIRLGGVAGVLDFLRVHVVERVANTKVIGSDVNNKVAICSGTPVTLSVAEENCAKYAWYDSPTGGNKVADGSTYTLPAGTPAGIYRFYIQPIRYDCESLSRGEVIVEIKATTPKDAIANITLNGTNNTSVCSPTGSVTLKTNVTGTPTLTNPVYYWYKFDGTTSQLIAGANTNTLNITGLTAGTYTYYVGVSSNEYCETAAADRKTITFTILPPSKATDISLNNTSVCSNVAASLTPSATALSNPVFTWYFDNNKTTAIVNNSTVSGVTFTISPLGVLTVSGLTKAMSPISYYVAVASATSCENLAGDLKAGTIIVIDPDTPTAPIGTQIFCKIDAPTFASIKVNESNVVWYNAANGGTEIPLATALTSGTYYGGIRDLTTGCESSNRLQVVINVTDPATPSTTNNSQKFCKTDAPKVANIQVTQANIIWYDAAIGGTVIPATADLTTRAYYAVIKDAATGCESSVRLQVNVTVGDPIAPTTNNANQTICSNGTTTVANIQVNGSNIVWYDAEIGGNVVSTTAPLTSRIYYAVTKDPVSGCESTPRLKVTVTVSNPAAPTTNNTTQRFCVYNVPTVANIQVNEANIVWYGSLTSTTPIAPTATIGTGSYYATIKNPTTGCESSSRLKVDVIVVDPGVPTSNSLNQNFCAQANPTIADIRVNETNVVWYSVANGGTVLAPTTALVAGDYFAAIKDALSGCEGTQRLKITVKLGSSINPTTNNMSQTFCSSNSPKVSDIQVNETNVEWYTSATSQTPLPPTTPLVDGTYYGAISDPVASCKSIVRLQIKVTIQTGSPMPTTNSLSQAFCKSTNPKVSNIQVNETNVVWYNVGTGGTAIPGTTDLVTGDYFAEIPSSTGGCTTQTRLKIAVTVNPITSPTTNKPIQTFCVTATPTVANIQVNEADIDWYNVATGGTPLAATTPLVSGIYYAEFRNKPVGACNTLRLAVTINSNDDSQVSITASKTNPCVFESVSYSVPNGKSNFVWKITNGTIVAGGGANDSAITVTWPAVGAGKIEVTYINSCDASSSKSLNVSVISCSDLVITNVVDITTPKYGDMVMFTVTVKNAGNGNFIDAVVKNLLPSGFKLTGAFVTTGIYDTNVGVWTIPGIKAAESISLQLTAQVLNPNGGTNKPGRSNKSAASDPDMYTSVATIETTNPVDSNLDNNTAKASVFPDGGDCLTVYNEFTPNNDGANDLFKIECIETYPNNELQVFNRYGALVYSQKNYANDWDGTANVSGVISRGDMLPTGTYFYVLDSGDGTVKKGWLSIMR